MNLDQNLKNKIKIPEPITVAEVKNLIIHKVGPYPQVYNPETITDHVLWAEGIGGGMIQTGELGGLH